MRPDWYDINLVCTTDPGGRYSYWWWFILGQFDPDFTVDWELTVKKEKKRLRKLLDV